MWQIQTKIIKLTQPTSTKEILNELQISTDDCYRALSVSKDEDLELYLKTQPNILIC